MRHQSARRDTTSRMPSLQAIHQESWLSGRMRRRARPPGSATYTTPTTTVLPPSWNEGLRTACNFLGAIRSVGPWMLSMAITPTFRIFTILNIPTVRQASTGPITLPSAESTCCRLAPGGSLPRPIIYSAGRSSGDGSLPASSSLRLDSRLPSRRITMRTRFAPQRVRPDVICSPSSGFPTRKIPDL